MIGDNSRRIGNETAKNASKNDGIVRAVFRTDSKPLDPNRKAIDLLTDERMFQTNLSYSIQYKPYAVTNQGYNESNNPFVIKADFIPPLKKISSKSGVVRVSSYQDLVERAKTNCFLQWLLDWTTLQEIMFDLAEACPGLLLYFSVDINRYITHLREQGCNETFSSILVFPEIVRGYQEKKTAQYTQYRLNVAECDKAYYEKKKQQRGENKK